MNETKQHSNELEQKVRERRERKSKIKWFLKYEFD